LDSFEHRFPPIRRPVIDGDGGATTTVTQGAGGDLDPAATRPLDPKSERTKNLPLSLSPSLPLSGSFGGLRVKIETIVGDSFRSIALTISSDSFPKSTSDNDTTNGDIYVFTN